MTTLQQIDLTCPLCSFVFTSQAVRSVDVLGKRTDFHERVAGTQPLPFLLHTCAKCGFTGSEYDYGDEADLSPTLREHVWDELAPRLPQGQLTGSEKYELAAKVAAWQGLELHRIADLYLRAAWCCVDEGDVEAERYFRRHAAWTFEEALAASDHIEPEDRAVTAYLIGELWRRIGDVKQARAWFDRVPSEITDRDTQEWITKAAKRQRDDPREWLW